MVWGRVAAAGPSQAAAAQVVSGHYIYGKRNRARITRSAGDVWLALGGVGGGRERGGGGGGFGGGREGRDDEAGWRRTLCTPTIYLTLIMSHLHPLDVCP